MESSQRRHRASAIIVAAVAVVVLTGCLNTEMGSSDRGADSPAEPETSVDSAYLVPAYTASCAIQVGDSGVLRFTATNTNVTENERLMSVSTPAADAIEFSPPLPADIPPQQTIAVGRDVAGAPRLNAVVQNLDQSARAGTTLDVTFSFQRAGDIAVPVPVEACPTQS